MRTLLAFLLLLIGLLFLLRNRDEEATLPAPAPVVPANTANTADEHDGAGERLRLPSTGGESVRTNADDTTGAASGEDGHPKSSDVGPEPPEDFSEELVERSDAEWLAHYGFPADSALALRISRWGPPDPVEQGDASLHLRLVDEATGELVKSQIVLWRLEAPSNRFWTRGDQDVAQAWSDVDGCVFEDLAPGRYRPVLHSERKAAAHQDEIEVFGRTEKELAVDLPRHRPVWMVFKDAEPPFPSVEALFGPLEYEDRSHEIPDWVNGRTMRPEFEDFDYLLSFEGMNSESDASWIWLRPEGGRFDFGTLPEDTRQALYRRAVSLRIDGAEPRDVFVRNPQPDPERRAELTVEVSLD